LKNLNKINEDIQTESKIFYEIDLEKIKNKVGNFFSEIKLDFSIIHDYDKNRDFENLKESNEIINENLDKISKLVKTVKNELFIVLKNKIEALNKDSLCKFENIKNNISETFTSNVIFIEAEIKEIKKTQNEIIENKLKYEKELDSLNKEIKNYISLLAINENEVKELKIIYKADQESIETLKNQKESITYKLKEIEKTLEENEKLLIDSGNKLNNNEEEIQKILKDVKEKIIEDINNKNKIQDLNNSLEELEKEKMGLVKKINLMEITISDLKKNEEVNESNNKMFNEKLLTIEKEKKLLSQELLSYEIEKNEMNDKNLFLRNDLNILNSNIKNLEDSICGFKLEIKNLTSYNDLIKEEMIKLEKKYEEQINIKNVDLKINIEKLEKKNTELNEVKNDIYKRNLEHENLKNNVILNLENQVNDLIQKNEELRSKLITDPKNEKKNEYLSETINNINKNSKTENSKSNKHNTTDNLNSNISNDKGKKYKKRNNSSIIDLSNYNIEKTKQEANYSIMQIEKKINELNQLLEETIKKYENQYDETCSIKNLFKKFTKNLEEFNNIENKSNNEIMNKDNLLRELEEKITFLINYINDLLNNNNQLKNKYENEAKKIEKVEIEKELSLLKNEMEENLKILRLKEDETKSLKEIQEKFNNHILCLNNQIKNLENDNRDLNENTCLLKIEISQLEKKLEFLENEKTNLKKIYEEDIVKNEKSLINEYELIEKNNFVNNQNKELKNEIILLKSEIKKLDDLGSNFIKTNSENNDLKNQINILTQKKEDFYKIEEGLKKTIMNYKITFKQIFLMLLDDDIFIDLIQKTFNDHMMDNNETAESLEKSSHMFFEKIYSLSKLVKPKIVFSFIKLNSKNLLNSYIHNELSSIFSKKNESLGIINEIEKLNSNRGIDYPNNNNKIFEKLKKLLNDSNLMINNINRIEEISYAKINIDYLEKLDSELSEFDFSEAGGSAFILSDFIIELQYYIEYLSNYLIKKNKIIDELNLQLKSAKETLEESKKNESEKYEILNKNIQKLQQECRDFYKIEKLLKENLENTENNFKDSKSENEKLFNKLKVLNILYEELNNEKRNIIEKNIEISHKIENFKIENLEITEIIIQRDLTLKSLNDRIEILNREKNELFSQAADNKKLNDTLHHKNFELETKENEIEKMRTSYSELEEFIESLKNEKEQTLEIYKKQIFDLNNEIENLKENSRFQEDKLNQEQINRNEELEKNISDLQLENKYLKEQKDKMRKYSEEILQKVKNDLKETEYLIDKRIISNLLVKYFDKNTNNSIKTALLDTLANFMGFNNEERVQIGLYVNNNNNVINSNNSKKDKLSELSDDLYNFILNA